MAEAGGKSPPYTHTLHTPPPPPLAAEFVARSRGKHGCVRDVCPDSLSTCASVPFVYHHVLCALNKTLWATLDGAVTKMIRLRKVVLGPPGSTEFPAKDSNKANADAASHDHVKLVGQRPGFGCRVDVFAASVAPL